MFKKCKLSMTAVSLAGTFLCGSGVGKAAAPAYTLDELRSVKGGAFYAFAINNRGQATGEAGGQGHAFLYQSGRSRDLGSLFEGRFSMGFGINDRGMVTGQSDIAVSDGQQKHYETHAFLTYSDGVMVDLGTLTGGSSVGLGINNLGEVVGSSGGRAFLYRNGRMTDMNSSIGPKAAWTLEAASGINDAGDVVGTGQIIQNGYESFQHGFLYRQGKITDLGVLPGGLSSTGGNLNYGGGINAHGDIIGSSEGASPDGTVRSHAVFYRNGHWVRVEATCLMSGFYTLNNCGQAVGFFVSSQRADSHAFLLTNNRFVDLNTVFPLHRGWRLEAAYGINDRGQIIGIGFINGKRQAFLLSPIRNPS